VGKDRWLIFHVKIPETMYKKCGILISVNYGSNNISSMKGQKSALLSKNDTKDKGTHWRSIFYPKISVSNHKKLNILCTSKFMILISNALFTTGYQVK
jgi:hypothetical protein